MTRWKARRNIEHLARPPGQVEASAAARTGNMIKDAVLAEAAFKNRSLDLFLQGSYANSTNISGGSDVDVVSRLVDTFSWDFFRGVGEDAQKRIAASITPATYSWTEYRRDLLAALLSRFPGAVVNGDKTIKVNGSASGSRLPADLVPCATFRMYKASGTYEEGICFWSASQPSQRIANFPKQHRANLSAKNAAHRAGPKFKGIVRAVKRLRDELDSTGHGLKRVAASYWIECLMYNVPDSCYAGSYDDALLSCLAHLWGKVEDESVEFLQANEVYLLFHPSFWSRSAAKRLVNEVWDAAYEHIG